MSKQTIKKVKASYDHNTKLAVASTATIDRMGESITQEGWDLTNYKKNGAPILFAHNDREILIGNSKRLRVDKSMGALVFEPDFHEETETARAIKALFEQGRMKTFSVGFMPLEMDGNTYTKQELLEISAVNVPANPDAMMLAYRSMMHSGIKKSVAEDISGVKKAFEKLFKGAIADELANPDEWEVKSDRMDSVFDIFYAFCDVYFDEMTSPDDFNTLLTECISLLRKVANGTYIEPGETVQANYAKVLDKDAKADKVESNKVKETSSEPVEQRTRSRQAVTKVIAKAADQLLADEKQDSSKEDRIKMMKIIKRSAEILSKSNKDELKNG